MIYFNNYIFLMNFSVYNVAFLGTLCNGSIDLVQFCSDLQEPGITIPSLFSVSKTPGGVYIEFDYLLLLKKLCNNKQVIVTSLTFSASKCIDITSLS